MLNVPKKNLSQLPAGKYGKSTKHSARQSHGANQGKSGLEVERVWALGAWRGLGSGTQHAARKQQEMQFWINEEMEKWIEDYVQSGTAVARKRVQDAETSIKQKQDEMRNAEKVVLTTTKPETTFEEMLNAIGDSLHDVASSDAEEDGAHEDDDEEDPAGGKLSEDDEPGWVMGTISQTVHYSMESFRQQQMTLDKLTHPGRRGAADNFHKRDKKYGTT